MEGVARSELIHRFMRCLIPVCFGALFIMAGLRGSPVAGARAFPVAFCLIGVFVVAVGVYYGIYHLGFRDGTFIAYPGSRRYRIDDVALWKLGQELHAQPGHRRYL